MLPVKLSPLHQIEYAVSDLEYHVKFFSQVLREPEVEQVFARALSNPAIEIRHMGLAKTVQQFCEPKMGGYR